MRLRTTLVLAFIAVCLVQVAAVAPFAVDSLERLLTRQQDARIDGILRSVQAALERNAVDVRRSMDELAQSEALERVARELGDGELPPQLATAAQELMTPRGLSVLSLFDESGRTLSSGHLPARLGDLDPALFSLTSHPESVSPVLVERALPSGLIRAPALATARALDYGERRLWISGGVLLDESFARFLSDLSGARVEIRAEGQPAAAAGEAQAPTVERSISLPPAELRFVFSRADLEAAQLQIIRAFAAIFALGLALATLGGLLLARRITRPVEALTQAARQLSRGPASLRVDAKASGEVGELISTFNGMVRELEAKTEQLLASERIAAWQEVARRLAHEIKNPLTPIRMSLETLVAEGHGEPARFQALFRQSATVMLEEVDRLRRIVDEFSRFARLPKPALSEVDLSELVSQALVLLSAHPEGVELIHRLEPAAFVSADRDQLTQVLHNLVKNAQEALPGGGKIEVRVRTAQNEVLLEVEDSGPGIAPEARAHLFEPYFTTKQGGTGLGLAIAARICQEHGGRLEVGGLPGKGATFSVVLPRSK